MLRIVGKRRRVWNYTVPSVRAHVLCHRRKHGGIKDQKRFRIDATGLSHVVSIHLLAFVMFFFLTQTPDVFSTVCVRPVKVKGLYPLPDIIFAWKSLFFVSKVCGTGGMLKLQMARLWCWQQRLCCQVMHFTNSALHEQGQGSACTSLILHSVVSLAGC